MYRQLLYVSSSNPPGREADVDAIYERSRHNNAIDGVTGLLFSDGHRFLQVLEGSSESVQVTFDRIRDDPRHHQIAVLRDAVTPEREFGYWSMADRRLGERSDMFDARLRRLLMDASPAIRDAFLHLIDERSAA